MPASTQFWTAVAAVSVAVAVRPRVGNLHPAGLLFLAVALCALFVALNGGFVRAIRPAATVWVLAVGAVLEAFWLAFREPAVFLAASEAEMRTYFFVVRAMLVTAAVLYFLPRVRRFWFPVLLVLHVYIGVWVLHHGTTKIDVLVFQNGASEVVLRGENPYAITFPDPYEGKSRFYGEGLTGGGRILVGYPYMPLDLALGLPAYIAGEVRYAHIAAVVLAAALMYWMAADTAGRVAAALFCFTPWVFQLEYNAWTDAFVVLLLAMTVYAQARGSGAAASVLGLFLATKQFNVLVLPAMLRAVGVRAVVIAVLLALITVLPFFLWDPGAFLHSVVWFQFRQPWRTDSLSFAIAFERLGLPRMPWLGFVTAAIATVLVMLRRETHPAAAIRNAAFIFLTFFAFSKQAFYNYYFVVIATLWCSFIAAGRPKRVRQDERASDGVAAGRSA